MCVVSLYLSAWESITALPRTFEEVDHHHLNQKYIRQSAFNIIIVGLVFRVIEFGFCKYYNYVIIITFLSDSFAIGIRPVPFLVAIGVGSPDYILLPVVYDTNAL